MPKLTIQINDFLSLTVMLLMVIALIGGQSNAGAYAAERAAAIESVASGDEHFNLSLDGHVKSKAIEVSIAVVSELGKLRNERETDK